MADKKAWVHQLKKHVEEKGEAKASWYVTHYDPEGRLRTKSCGPGKIGKTAAEKLADTTHSQLVTGTYESKTKSGWDKFRSELFKEVFDRMPFNSKDTARQSLDAFERVSSPKTLASINAQFIQKFITNRLKDPGLRGGKLSAATVNKDLRYIKLALNYAEEWGRVSKAPKIRFLREAQLLPTYVSPEHFAAIYKACETAEYPDDIPNVSACDWWRCVIVIAYMTGWRIGQVLSIEWKDVDMESRTITTRWDVVGNKGKREVCIPIHAVVFPHIKQMEGSFNTHLVPWGIDRRQLWPTFHAIQANAKLADGKPMPKEGKGGQWYGFHDLRRGFATENAADMDLFELQQLMQHASLETTKTYVNMAKRLKRPVENLYVPAVLKVGETG